MILTWNLDQQLTWQRKQNVKKIDDDVMLADCYVIVIFQIYGQFGAIRKPDSKRIVWKTYIFIKSKLLSNKNWKQNTKIFNTALTIFALSKGTSFSPKMLIFYQKKSWQQN